MCKQIFAYSARKPQCLARSSRAANSLAWRRARLRAMSRAMSRFSKTRFHSGKSPFFAAGKNCSRVCACAHVARTRREDEAACDVSRAKKISKKIATTRARCTFFLRGVRCACARHALCATNNSRAAAPSRRARERALHACKTLACDPFAPRRVVEHLDRHPAGVP